MNVTRRQLKLHYGIVCLVAFTGCSRPVSETGFLDILSTDQLLISKSDQIYRFDLVKNRLDYLTDGLEVAVVNPGSFCFEQDRRLFLYDLKTNKKSSLTNFDGTFLDTYPTWNPADQRIYFARSTIRNIAGVMGIEERLNYDIYSVSLTDKSFRRETSERFTSLSIEPQAVLRTQLFFTASQEGNDVSQIYKLDITTNRVSPCDLNALSVTVSRDGKLFSTLSAPGFYTIKVLSPKFRFLWKITPPDQSTVFQCVLARDHSEMFSLVDLNREGQFTLNCDKMNEGHSHRSFKLW